MPTLTKQLPSLIGGVSQQPDSIRFDNQCAEQINFLSTPSRGLIKRGPMEYVTKLPTFPEDAYVEFFDLGPDNKYFMVIDYNELKLFDIDGTPISITYSCLNLDYLKTTAPVVPKQAFRTLSISDTILLVNTDKTVTMKSDISSDRAPEALIYVKQGVFGKTYRVNLTFGGSSFGGAYETPDGQDSDDTRLIDTAYIASRLASSLASNSAASQWKFVRRGSVIHVYRNDSEDFTVSTSDGFGDTAMYAIKGEHALFSELPRHSPVGFKVAITGDVNNIRADSYIVEATSNTPVSGSQFPIVTWQESVGNNLEYIINKNSMPFHIERTPGTYEATVDGVEWGRRTVGNNDTAPLPNFVNSKIKGMFFFKGRLGFFNKSTVNMSESGNIFNFFPTSVATLLGADPIEVTINTAKTSDIEDAIPWNELVVLKTEKNQHILRSQGNLTNESISITTATQFEVNSNVRPKLSGNNIYFANNNQDFTEVREYFNNDLVDGKDSANITAHIPTYIPSDVDWMDASPSAKYLVFHTPRDPSTIYLYQYLWSGSEKVQSSWSKLTFGDSGKFYIRHGEFVGKDLYLIVRDFMTLEIFLTKVTLSDSLLDPGQDFKIYLDNRIYSNNSEITKSIDIGANTTTYTLPFFVANYDMKAINVEDSKYGNPVTVLDVSNNDVTVQGISNDVLCFGLPYSARYDLSTVYLRNGGGQGSLAITDGRTHLLKMDINHFDTSRYKVNVNINGREARSKEFTGRRKGSSLSPFGTMARDTGTFTVPINGRNTRTSVSIENSSHLPSNIQFIDVTLRYWTTRGQRTT